MRILLTELPDGEEHAQALFHTKTGSLLALVEEILVSPEDQAAVLWPDVGRDGWISGPRYVETPTDTGVAIGLWGIARKLRTPEDTQVADGTTEEEEVKP